MVRDSVFYAENYLEITKTMFEFYEIIKYYIVFSNFTALAASGLYMRV